MQVTTTFTAKALESGVQVYQLAFGPEEWGKTSWKEATLKGSSEKLLLEDLGFDTERFVLASFIYVAVIIDACSSGTHNLAVTLPKALQKADIIDLIVDTVQTGTTSPWPARAVQTDEQSLKLETQLFILSPYRTVTQRTKIRSDITHTVAACWSLTTSLQISHPTHHFVQ